jgi:Domain of unknown function (DUF397)
MSSERVWRTSSYSGTQGGNCVQVATHDGMILVRDSKDHGEGHIHSFPAARWRTFVAAVRGGEFGPADPGRMP